MANLGTFVLDPSDTFQNLSIATGISFINGDSYQIQVEGDIFLCENNNEPDIKDNRGHRIINDTWTYDCEGVTLWYKTYRNTTPVIINISK